MSLFNRSKRPVELSAPKSSKTSRKIDPSNAQLVSEAETIKYHSSRSHHPSSATAGVNASHRGQPVKVPEIATFHKQTNISSTFNVVRSSTTGYPTQAPRNAAPTQNPHNRPEVYPSNTLNHQQNSQHQSYQHQYYNPQLAPVTSSKPAVAPASHPHRVSVQSLHSINTASTTSRSSVDQISIDDLQHSWDSNTLSTAPSSTVPHSTESLVRIPVASDPRDREGVLSPLERSMGASRGFPLVESDGQSWSTTHGYAAGEQAPNALPLPNSEYEAPARVRSLRRTKAQITSPSNQGTGSTSTLSLCVATSTAGRASPTPVQRPPSPPKAHEHRRTQSEIPPATEMAHRNLPQDHANPRASLLSRVMSTSTPRHSHSSSTASTRTNMHQPRVPSTAQSAHTNMAKLKQTTVPRIGSNNDAKASPMIDSRDRQFASLHSPRQASMDNTPASWSSVKSPTMTSSGPARSNLVSAVMSPNLSTLASPRTLVSGSAEIPPILPSQLHHSAGSTIGKRGSVFVEDRPSSANGVAATPSSPASHVVRTLFSSLTSRPHRNSTPQPLRGSSLSNPPITAQEVASPRLVAAAAGILPPPPIPPQSTRPDAPQQGYVEDALQYNNPTSPRHSTADFTKSAHSKPAVESHLANMRSPPTQSSTLRSYGLDGNTANPGTPSSGAHRVPLGTPYHIPSRTLMSDSEVTTVTTVSVTRSTVVSQATATHPVERRGSNPQRRSSTNSTRGATQQQQQQYEQQRPQSSQLPQQQPSSLFNMFRPKSPKHFPSVERSNSPAPPLPPIPSKTPPPRAATASPRRFGFSLPLNFRHKPKKSISGASVEVHVGDAFGMAGDGAMSSRGSLKRSATPDLPYSEYPGSMVKGGRYKAAKHQQRNRAGEEDTGDEGEGYQDYADRDDDDNADVDDSFMEDRMRDVLYWSQTTEQGWQQSGKRRARPGVSFDIPASESERDDSGLTAVSVVPGAGRVLRYAHQRQYQETRQFSDNESFVY